MVIDIALGVLAVLILRYWPAILAAGFLSVIAFAVIAIAGSIIYAISLHEVLVKQIAIVSIVVGNCLWLRKPEWLLCLYLRPSRKSLPH